MNKIKYVLATILVALAILAGFFAGYYTAIHNAVPYVDVDQPQTEPQLIYIDFGFAGEHIYE